MHSRNRSLLIVKEDSEIVLALESHSLLGADFGASREDIRRNGSWTRDIGGSGGEIRSLNIISDGILNLDILGLELPAEAGTVEGCAEDGGFVCVDVEGNFITVSTTCQHRTACEGGKTLTLGRFA